MSNLLHQFSKAKLLGAGPGVAPSSSFSALFPKEADAPQSLNEIKALPENKANISCDIIETLSGFEALRAEWCDLFAKAALPHHHFLSFNWNWHWTRHYLATPAQRQKTRLHILTLRDNGVLKLVWPLVRERRLGFTHLRFMGEPVSQYGDVLVSLDANKSDYLHAAYDQLCGANMIDALFLRKVRADSNLAPLLLAAGTSVTSELAAPFLDLTRFSCYEDYFKLFSKKSRKNRRRHRRRMQEEGAISWRFLTQGVEAGRVATEAMALKRIWLEKKGLLSRAFAGNEIDRFFAAAVASKTHSVSPHITKWEVDNKSASIEIGLLHQDYHIAHVGVYDTQFERHSPGTLQMEDTIRNCIDQGIKTYDLLAPSDDYKMQWCDNSVAVYDFAQPVSALGHGYVRLYLKHIRQGLKKAMNIAPPQLRKAVTPLLSRLLKKTL